MRLPEFLAVIHAEGGEAAALALADRHAPSSVTRLRLAEGGLLLCRWDDRPVPPHGAIAVVDGTGGAPERALPRALIDTDGAPAGLVAAASQHRSYLWLGDDRRLACWTDHLGTSRVYRTYADGCQLLSDDPVLLAGADAVPDLSAIGSFLVNGHLVRNRTLFAAVDCLPLASCVSLSVQESASRPYWRHRPGSDIGADMREAAREMWSRITAATLGYAEGRHVVISLSGGNDSTSLLGILHGAGHPVSAFSFAVGEPRPGSDADVARRRAAFLGIEHKIHRFDQDFDIAGMLRSHVQDGLIMRKPCFEVSAYERAGADAAAHSGGAVMYFGDEAFGQGAFCVGTEHELLGSAALKSPDILSRFAPHLSADIRSQLAASLWEDYAQILAQPRMRANEDTKDMLFLDTYLRANMVEMRRQAAARRSPVALPFLDLSVIDMARHIPAGLRIGKRLFNEVVQGKLPDLFRIQGARNPQGQPVIGDEIRRQKALLHTAIGQLDRGIPGVISPAEMSAALDTICDTPAAPLSRPRTVGRSALRIVIKSGLLPRSVVNALRRRYWNRFNAGADRAVLLMRALHLAMTFDGLPARHEAAAPRPRRAGSLSA
ncbi:asparagine synthase-related protein [Emcibacter sp. SYSU 3D8]|uniref:asparagine synthase-related protein n=1 Tax=Emcibacter sp. SYSU 3D8 TaxID=3133969 RepID=UPI0031FF322A